MPTFVNKHKHLDYIQTTINRFSQNSFLIKGWCLTIQTILLALNVKNSNNNIYLISILPIICFWSLDGYYLKHERMFRKLYDKVIKLKEKDIDFSMKHDKLISESVIKVMFSITLFSYYFTMFGIVLILSLIH